MTEDPYDAIPPPDTEPETEESYDDFDISTPTSDPAEQVSDTEVVTGADALDEQDAAQSVLSTVLDDLVDKAVRKRLSQEAEVIAAVKFEEALTPELHAALAAAAEAKIAAALAIELAQAERAAAGPYYRNCYRFFAEFLAPTYRRRVVDSQSFHWCPQWQKHAEARNRIEALWRSWEHLRLDPTTGLSVWWKDHADHHMAYLFSPDGPFRDCSPTKGHKPLPPLPFDEIPPILFDLVPGDPPVGPPAQSPAATPTAKD